MHDIAPTLENTEIPDRKHILVVEDNADVLATLSELLTMLGHTFECALSAEAAMELLSGADVFDILLTDITLSGMSGIELARKAVITRPTITIIFASGYDALRCGALDFPFLFLQKPYTLFQLKEILLKTFSLPAG